MYYVAEINEEACVANKGCRLCIMYCPEANCIMMNDEKNLFRGSDDLTFFIGCPDLGDIGVFMGSHGVLLICWIAYGPECHRHFGIVGHQCCDRKKIFYAARRYTHI